MHSIKDRGFGQREGMQITPRELYAASATS